MGMTFFYLFYMLLPECYLLPPSHLVFSVQDWLHLILTLGAQQEEERRGTFIEKCQCADWNQYLIPRIVLFSLASTKQSMCCKSNVGQPQSGKYLKYCQAMKQRKVLVFPNTNVKWFAKSIFSHLFAALEFWRLSQRGNEVCCRP